MEVIHKDDEKKGIFYLKDGETRAAEMTYVWVLDQYFIIDHTEVKPKYQGQGLGKILFEAAVEFARKGNYKIMPLCPFAKLMFDRNKIYNDIRQPL